MSMDKAGYTDPRFISFITIYPSLQTFTITVPHGFIDSLPDLVPCLRALPNLTSFRIDAPHSTVHNDLLSEMSRPPPTSSDRPHYLLPALRVLEMRAIVEYAPFADMAVSRRHSPTAGMPRFERQSHDQLHDAQDLDAVSIGHSHFIVKF